MNKLEISKTLMMADERITRLERDFSETYEKLRVHEHYMRLTARLIDRGEMCCSGEDRLKKEIYSAAVQMEREFHQELSTSQWDSTKVKNVDESQDIFAETEMKIHPSLNMGEPR